MAIILNPDISEVEDGLELEEIEEAATEPNRHSIRNTTGSFTITGEATSGEQSKVITAVMKTTGEQDWLVLEAHLATDEEKQAREENIGRAD